LSGLLKELLRYEKDFADFTDTCLRITDFYFEHRYPLRVTTPIIRADLEKLFAEAEELIARLQSRAAPPPAENEA
jgi:hypothetical protein